MSRLALLYGFQQPETLLAVLITVVGLVLSITITENPLVWISVWLVFGVLAVGGLTVAGARDSAGLADAMVAQIHPGELRSPDLRDAVSRAKAYQSALRRAVRQGAAPEVAEAADDLAFRMNEPIELIFILARHLDCYREDHVLHDELRALRAHLDSHVASSSNPGSPLDTLERLNGLMAEAQTTIDATLLDLAAAYRTVQAALVTPGGSGGSLASAEDELEKRTAQLRELSLALDALYPPSRAQHR